MQGSTPLAPNEAPDISSTPVESVYEGENYAYQVVATDANNHKLTYELITKPAGMTIDAVTGKIEWQTRQSHVGTHRVIIRVSDGRDGTDLQSYNLKVLTTNIAPRITSTPTGPAALGREYTYQVEAEDDNGNVLEYRVDAASKTRGVPTRSSADSCRPTSCRDRPRTPTRRTM